MDIYREKILEHYKNPRNFGQLEKPDASYEQGNTLCGDRIRMDIETTGEKTLKTVKFSGEGCAISLAAASMLTEKARGMSIGEIKNLRYEDIKEMLGTDLSPARIKCALLPLEVLQKAIGLL